MQKFESRTVVALQASFNDNDNDNDLCAQIYTKASNDMCKCCPELKQVASAKRRQIHFT